MVYVTGDFHADIEKFSSKEMKKLKKGDTLFICGDFGFIWQGGKAEEKILKKIGKHKYKIIFLEGTHDNIELIRKYEEETLFGGKVRKISGNLFYAERGQIFEIKGKKIFTMGGGETDDAYELIEGVNWWREELPTLEETEKARENLAEAGNKVDYIISHECAGKMRDFLLIGKNFDECDNLQRFFDEISKSISYKAWFFGRYHKDKIISQKSVAIFEKVLPLE